MKILVAGSAGHLGEALMRALPGLGHRYLPASPVAAIWPARWGSGATMARLLPMAFTRLSEIFRRLAGMFSVAHFGVIHSAG